jgi:predicted phage tail protein
VYLHAAIMTMVTAFFMAVAWTIELNDDTLLWLLVVVGASQFLILGGGFLCAHQAHRKEDQPPKVVPHA